MTDKMQIKRDVKEKKPAMDNPNGIGIGHLTLDTYPSRYRYQYRLVDS